MVELCRLTPSSFNFNLNMNHNVTFTLDINHKVCYIYTQHQPRCRHCRTDFSLKNCISDPIDPIDAVKQHTPKNDVIQTIEVL